ncbi:MAG: 50S ribosomal protein L4 [Candidatus Altiarchaeales archaeon]|nr:50S ribosomal protein L4 [Candidatus Altiarchaeales archaeon]MBD3416335.1 50S ribosomal protein L4 [Candidatus Altiarchaeales archaeon]
MVNVYLLDGKVKGKVDLPKVFQAPHRPDLIQKAVVAEQANVRQPYGVSSLAGLKTSADYFGSRRRTYRQTINRGMTRLPRVKSGGGGLGQVRRVPQSTGGRRAHPPRGRDYTRKLNRKEYMIALHSAIASTASRKLVEGRGHTADVKEVPIVVEDKIEGLKHTKDVLKMFKSLGLDGELASKKKRKMLIVVGEDKGIFNAASNIEGVDVATVNDLDVELLAPGTQAGRLTVWSEAAVKRIGEDGTA